MNDVQDAYTKSFESILEADSRESVFNELVRILPSYGVKHFAYHAVEVGRIRLGTPLIISSYPSAWMERYISRDYLSIDPVLRESRRQMLPLDWGSIAQSQDDLIFFGEASDFGVGKHGLTFPIRGHLGDYALFTLTCDAADWSSVLRNHIRDFQVIGQLVHARMIDLYFAEPPHSGVSLARRERECLHLAALGLQNKAIAGHLGISERVVRAYFETARAKLNCYNRTHVVSRAIAMQLIDPEKPLAPSLTAKLGLV